MTTIVDKLVAYYIDNKRKFDLLLRRLLNHTYDTQIIDGRRVYTNNQRMCLDIFYEVIRGIFIIIHIIPTREKSVDPHNTSCYNAWCLHMETRISNGHYSVPVGKGFYPISNTNVIKVSDLWGSIAEHLYLFQTFLDFPVISRLRGSNLSNNIDYRVTTCSML